MSLDWDKFKSAFAGYVSSNRAPCSDGYANQCALRLSHSLVDAGWPFNGRRQPYIQGPLCTHSKARGAQSLADYLERYLVRPKVYKKKADPKSGIVSSVPGEYEVLPDGSTKFYSVFEWFDKKAVDGQKLRGIIFFNGTDHIDAFDFQNRNYEHSGLNNSTPGIIGEEYVSAAFEVRAFFQ